MSEIGDTTVHSAFECFFVARLSSSPRCLHRVREQLRRFALRNPSNPRHVPDLSRLSAAIPSCLRLPHFVSRLSLVCLLFLLGYPSHFMMVLRFVSLKILNSVAGTCSYFLSRLALASNHFASLGSPTESLSCGLTHDTRCPNLKTSFYTPQKGKHTEKPTYDPNKENITIASSSKNQAPNNHFDRQIIIPYGSRSASLTETSTEPSL